MHKLYLPGGLKIAVGLLLVIASVSHGQTTATVTGEVEETTGGVLPQASVSMTNVGTGIVSKTETNDQGSYRISGLDPGVYTAEVSKQGFKSTVKNDIQLHVEDIAAINFTLEVGAVSESVTVEAGAPLVDTQSTSLGETIEGRQVQDTPLNGRNAMNLMALVPGVIPQGLSQGNPASNQGSNNTNNNGFGNYQVGGGLAGWNATFVDGANVNFSQGLTLGLIPTQDSVGEFRVDTNAVKPQFGAFAGGVINFSTKSGGNDFHGTAYDYVRNTILDANTFFNNRLDAPVPVLHQNQFGADLGGPIIRNKTFFFFSWESARLLTAAAQSFVVPTPAEINGDFTANYGTTTDKIADYANMVNGVPQPPEACPGGAINKICPQHLSPAVQAMYKLHYWQPVESNPAKLALLESQGYNSQFVGKQPNNEIQYVGRIDHQLSEKQRLFGRYTYWNVYIPNANLTKMPAIPTQPTTFTSQQYVAGDTYTFSPSLTADLRLAYGRWYFNQQNNGNGNFDLSVFGPEWAALAPQIPFKAPITIGPPSTWANEPYSINLYSLNRYNNYSLSLNLTKVVAHHTIQFGGEARRIENYSFGPFYPSGNFSFTRGGMAQFVTGISNFVGGSAQLENVINSDAYAYYQGYYVTDTWQATPKLALNLGVRWELPGAWLEKHDHNTVLLPDTANPLGSFANPVAGGPTTLMGVIAPVNSSAYQSRAQSQFHLDLFEPRLGAAYSINPRTVIRAGFGISHPCLGCGPTNPSPSPSSSPLNTATTLNPSGYSSIDNPYPNGLLYPLGRSTQLMEPYSTFKQTLIGSSVSGFEPHQTYPYVEQWNLNLQQSFGTSVAALLSYSGSQGRHLGSNSRNLDQLPDQYDSLGSQLLTPVPNPLFGIATPTGFVGGATANYGQFLVPYPQFSGVTSVGKYYGISSYNALSAQLRKRFSAGATISASYTWAHFITNVDNSAYDATGNPGPQDYTNPGADRSNSAADIPQYFTLNYLLDAPFGKGKRFLTNSNGLLDHVVSGWGLSGITTYESGFPLNLNVQGGNALANNFYAGTIRPNVVPGVSKTMPGSRFSRTNTTWFNTAAFSNPGNFAFGNESRVDSTLRADGLKDWDMALVKNTPVREGISIQFRAEYFNVFNHPQYGAPVNSLGNANFGKIVANTASGSTNINQPRIGQLSLRLNF